MLLSGTAVVATTAAFLAACFRLRSLVGFLLATYLLATAEIVGVVLFLSTGRWLTRSMLLGSVVLLWIVSVSLWVRCGKPRPTLSTTWRTTLSGTLRKPPVVVLAIVSALAHVYLLAGALTIPQSTPDALVYHLPRVALWEQQHGVGYIASSPDERVNASAPNAEIEIAVSTLLSGTDRYVPLVQGSALLAMCVGIFGIARRLGLAPPAAAFGAFVFTTFPVIALQSQTALNDIVLASLLVLAAYFLSGPSRTELALGSLALALALGTKLTAVIALPLLALFVLVSQPRSRWPGLSVAGGLALIVGSYWYLVNLAHTGRLDGGLATAFPQYPDRGLVSTVDLIRLLTMDLLELSGAEGDGRILRSPLPGAALGLALLTLGALLYRRNRRAALAAALVGLFAAVAAPMLVVWASAAENGVHQVAAALGFAASPSQRVPAELHESPMHSAYGLAFVLLLGGAGALAVREVRRRKLPYGALVAVASVPTTLVVLALVLAYDPMRMRFLAFPVALSAATFGLALRIRLLAWSAVALATVNLAVTVGYFALRPEGIALLAETRGTDRSARWLVQGESGGWSADSDAFRFLENQVPSNATLALAAVRDTYLYPLWNGGLERNVLFAPASDGVSRHADWLVLGPLKNYESKSLRAAGWSIALTTDRGWRIYTRRSPASRS